DRERGMGRALGVVVMGHGRAEDRHHAVTDVFVNGPAMLFEDAVDALEEAAEQRVQVLGIEFARKARVTRQISKQDGDLTALTGGSSSRRGRLRYVGWRCIGAMVSGSRDRLEQLLSRAEWDAELS